MIKISTERPYIEVQIDGGEPKRIPTTLTRLELASVADVDTESVAENIGWFAEFLRTYIGDVVDELGDDAYNEILQEWNEARGVSGAPSMGEQGPSRK